MRQKEWQSAFGEVPESFHNGLCAVLDGLERSREKKKGRLSSVLIAVALLTALLAGAGIAAKELGLFSFLTDASGPIVPLEGAAELVGRNLGTVENELVKLTLEEAVFDGQGVLMQIRLTPRNTERYALLNAFLQGVPEDIYDVEVGPAWVGAGTHRMEWMDGIACTIINDADDKRLLMDGVEVEIPAAMEEAQARGLPIFQSDGRLCFLQPEVRVLGRKDGRETIGYWINVQSTDGALELDTGEVEEQADGSVIARMSGMAKRPLDADEIELAVDASLSLDGKAVPLQTLTVKLPMGEETRRAKLTPTGERKGERVELLDARVNFSRIRGYLTVDYLYEPLESECMGLTVRVYDAEGRQIEMGGGEAMELEPDEYGLYPDEGVQIMRDIVEIQSFEDIPDVVTLVFKVIDEARYLGRIECRVTED